MRDYIFSDQVILFSGKRVAVLLLILGVLAIFSGVEHIARVQSLKPKITAKIFNQAQKDYLNKDFEKSIQRCNELLKSDPTNVLVLELLASAYLSIGEKDKSMEILAKIMAVNPGYPIGKGPLQKFFGKKKKGGKQ